MKLFFDLPQWLRVAIVSVSAGLLISLIGLWWVYGIEHKQPVWLEGDEAIQWSADQLPLKVTCDDHREDCKAAVKLWQDATCDHLIEYDEGEDGDIRIFAAGVNECDGKAEATFASKIGSHVDFVFVNICDPMLPYDVRAHAIGHGLGLAHADSSIMRPVQRADSLGERLGPYPRVFDKHARALNKRYCGQ